METLITAQKDQARSDLITLKSPGDNTGSFKSNPCAPVTLYLLGTLGVGETVKVQYKNGDNYVDAYFGDAVVQLTNTDNVKTVYGPFEFYVLKSATSAAVGVGISNVRGLNV
jgi:hypothetical protein